MEGGVIVLEMEVKSKLNICMKGIQQMLLIKAVLL